MGMKMKYEDGDTLHVMLGGMVNACGEVGLRIQKRVAKVTKTRIVDNLNTLRTRENSEIYTHMADDVQTRTTRDNFGQPIVKVSGGKKTGTLWHIVNDGSYNIRVGKRNRATHFMDSALRETDSQIDTIIDEELSKEGF